LSGRTKSIDPEPRAGSSNRKATREPFRVFPIFHDDRFTYIKSAAPEKPAVCEIKDGKPKKMFALHRIPRSTTIRAKTECSTVL
jgi:hypothetical protein